jgi:hypothetical protein
VPPDNQIALVIWERQTGVKISIDMSTFPCLLPSKHKEFLIFLHKPGPLGQAKNKTTS